VSRSSTNELLRCDPSSSSHRSTIRVYRIPIKLGSSAGVFVPRSFLGLTAEAKSLDCTDFCAVPTSVQEPQCKILNQRPAFVCAARVTSAAPAGRANLTNSHERRISGRRTSCIIFAPKGRIGSQGKETAGVVPLPAAPRPAPKFLGCTDSCSLPISVREDRRVAPNSRAAARRFPFERHFLYVRN
jgi:hypothetical protein